MATIWLDFPPLAAQVTFTKGPEVLIVDYSDSLEIVLTFVGAASQSTSLFRSHHRGILSKRS